MATYNGGELLKKARIKMGISQDELADGICTRESISRIERGKVMPSKYTLYALFERLGINPHEHASYFLDNRLLEVQELMDELDTELSFGRLERAEALIQELERSTKFLEEKLNKQYLFLAKLSFSMHKKENPEKRVQLALEGIRLIFKEFLEEKISQYILSTTDIRLISGLAIAYQEEKEIFKALNIFQQLLKNMDSRYMDKFERGRNYPMVVFNLSGLLVSENRYKEAIEVCGKGIEACRETGFLEFLPYIAFNMASALLEEGNLTESKMLIQEVFYTLSLYGKENQKTFVQDFAWRKFGIKFGEKL